MNWGLGNRETFVPQSYGFGVEVQIDWYEAYADLDGERVKLQVLPPATVGTRHAGGTICAAGAFAHSWHRSRRRLR